MSLQPPPLKPQCSCAALWWQIACTTVTGLGQARPSIHSTNSYGGLPNACYCSGHWSFSSKKEIQYFCPRGTYVLEETRQWTHYLKHEDYQFSSVQSLSRVRLFVTPWIAAHQASLSITNSRSLLKLMSIESVMPSSHLMLCCPLLFLPPISPSIRVFSNESTLRMRWPKYWSFSFSIIPSKGHPGPISFRMDWLDLLAVQGTLKMNLLNELFLLHFRITNRIPQVGILIRCCITRGRTVMANGEVPWA